MISIINDITQTSWLHKNDRNKSTSQLHKIQHHWKWSSGKLDRGTTITYRIMVSMSITSVFSSLCTVVCASLYVRFSTPYDAIHGLIMFTQIPHQWKCEHRAHWTRSPIRREPAGMWTYSLFTWRITHHIQYSLHTLDVKSELQCSMQ